MALGSQFNHLQSKETGIRTGAPHQLGRPIAWLEVGLVILGSMHIVRMSVDMLSSCFFDANPYE